MCKYKLLEGPIQNFIAKKANFSYFLNNIKEPAGHPCPAGPIYLIYAVKARMSKGFGFVLCCKVSMK